MGSSRDRCNCQRMAVALKKIGRNIYAVGNRTYSKAVDFAKKYGIEKVYDDYNDMFTDSDVDVIYITTPHNTHIEFMKKLSGTANIFLWKIHYFKQPRT